MTTTRRAGFLSKSVGWTLLFALATASTAAVGVAPTQREAVDWNQWRGPQRDGVAVGFSLPVPLPERLSLAWRNEVGFGHSSPVVGDSRVFQLSRQGDDEVVQAFSLHSGERLWRHSYPAPFTMHSGSYDHGEGPKATPTLWHGKLYTLGISGILSCYRAADGQPLWRREFADEFAATWPKFGASMSPLVTKGVVIVHLGGHLDGAMMALDAASGEVRWRLEGDGPGYASPLLVQIGGRHQIVTQTDRHIVGVDFDDGELLWRIPFATIHDQNIVTPLVVGGRLVFAGIAEGTFVVEIDSAGGQAGPREVWRNDAVSFYMSTPVLIDGRLFGLANRRKGQLVALDAASGEALWWGEERFGENAAIVLAGEHVLVLNERAELSVWSTDVNYELLRRYAVAESPTWSHPVPSREGILIKDYEGLALWSFEQSSRPALATPSMPSSWRGGAHLSDSFARKLRWNRGSGPGCQPHPSGVRSRAPYGSL